MLDHTQLMELWETIAEELEDNLLQILIKLNRTDRLGELLTLLEMQHLLDSGYHVYPSGKIVIVGEADVKAEVLLGVANSLGIDKKRFELYLDYNDSVKLDFKKMQFDPKYAAILVGPMPHSGKSKGDYSSVITAIEDQQGYPPVIRLGSNRLKITKSDFRTKLQELIQGGVIRV